MSVARSADPQAVAEVMEVLGCARQKTFNRCGRHEFLTWDGAWTDAGCPVAVAVVEAVTPTIAARTLEDAADRWQDHEFIEVDWLRASAAEIRNQPKENP